MRVAAAVLAGVLAPIAGTGCALTERDARAPATRTSQIRWSAQDPAEKAIPDVLDARARRVNERRRLYDVTVTMSSPYDSRIRFADAWRVLSSRGDFLGEREFHRHHAFEQPWTRTLRRLHIPAGVEEVVIEGRDVRNGYGGKPFFLQVPA